MELFYCDGSKTVKKKNNNSKKKKRAPKEILEKNIKEGCL